MKVGDIVKLKTPAAARAGVVTDFIDRKCWRTQERGTPVDWKKIDPEPHAVVLFENGIMRIPVVDLDIINVAR